jgi:hypothetical protein
MHIALKSFWFDKYLDMLLKMTNGKVQKLPHPAPPFVPTQMVHFDPPVLKASPLISFQPPKSSQIVQLGHQVSGASPPRALSLPIPFQLQTCSRRLVAAELRIEKNSPRMLSRLRPMTHSQEIEVQIMTRRSEALSRTHF